MNARDQEIALEARDRLTDGCATMDRLLTGLLDGKGRIADEVHTIRKLGKSLRGGFALFDLKKNAAREIQTIGRMLAGPRDAVSRQHTWQRLGWDGGDTVTSAISSLLEQQTHSAARKPTPESILWCRERVATAIKALETADPSTFPERLEPGLQRLYKKVEKRCRKMADGGDETFHNARKAVKAWLGAAGFLPKGVVVFPKRLNALADLLGDENDLATLSRWLDEHGFTHRFAPGLWKKIRKTRADLQSRAIKDARHLLGKS